MGKQYQTPEGRTLFVSDGIAAGKSFCTFWRKPSGSLKRLVTYHLPQRPTAAQAQSDLDQLAAQRGWSEAKD